MAWLAMATAFLIHQIISDDPLRPLVANAFDEILASLPRGVFSIGASWVVAGSTPSGEPLWPPTGDPWILSPWVTAVVTASILGGLACIVHLVALRVLIELQGDPHARTTHKVFTAAAVPTAWLTATVLVLYLALSTGCADQWQKMNVFAMKGSSSLNLVPVKLYLPFSASQLYQSSYWIYPDAPAAIVYNRYGAALVMLGALLLYAWLMLRCTRAARRGLADANSCPTCGYMRANPTAPCPECGHNAAPTNTKTPPPPTHSPGLCQDHGGAPHRRPTPHRAVLARPGPALHRPRRDQGHRRFCRPLQHPANALACTWPQARLTPSAQFPVVPKTQNSPRPPRRRLQPG